ncbi:MAG: hypothetical protein ACI3VN_10075 [Candidatus Onthomonas sp.]
MKPKTKICFFAFPFGDYEGVRQALDRRAAQGWAFAGRFGLITARFQATARQELHYDVVPAAPRRSPEEMAHEIQCRETQGWSPVDTLWGMDIYQSLPCQAPELSRTGDDYRSWQALFRSWLLWSLAFLAVTLAALGLVGRAFGLNWTALSHQWYLSDSQGILCLALPLGAILALLWLVWLIFCLLRRCKPHKPCSRGTLLVHGWLQALALGLLIVTLTVLWTDQVPRLWMRLALGAVLALTLLLAPMLAGGDRRRQILILGCGVFACLLLSMVLGWTVSPVRLDTGSEGSGWRQEEGLSILRAEELGLEEDSRQVSASYRREQSLLVRQETYYETWPDGTSLEVIVYTCNLPSLTGSLWADLVPEAALKDENQAWLDTGEWHQLWYRSGRQLVHLSGTPDWQADNLGQQALELVLAD